MESEEVDSEDNRITYSLDHFTDYGSVNELLDDAMHCYNDLHMAERILQELKRILDKYSEQPHLLDPYLESILNKVLSVVKDQNISIELKQFLFQCLFLFVSVRGCKIIIRFLPHEVSDLSIALNLLDELDGIEHVQWESDYFILLWLSIIIMLPFDMDRLDGVLDGSEDKKTIAERILNICKKYIMVSYKSRDAAAYLCARFLSRIDIKKMYLDHTIKWLCSEIATEEESSWSKYGPMITLALILKHGKREDLLPYVGDILKCLVDSDCYHNTYRLTRKYANKITQRVGLTCLRVKIASWRYNRGCRSLIAGLNANTAEPLKQFSSVSDKTDSLQNSDSLFDSGNEDITSTVEDVISYLLEALRNDDITVRWSAAKGIGRITDRLTSEFGDEVVDNVLTLFNPREPSYAWNGGCLALAELGRRGLLLPHRLPRVVDMLKKALIYDTPLKSTSAGACVRDAACYTTWSLARAYDPEVLRPYIATVAASLLVVITFDRQVSCRRAASATFQEHVGRQGSFPRGIEIVSMTDYFSVGSRKNAFLNISVFIAQFPEYTKQMIDHLFHYKIHHWDIEIRKLSSKALHNLTTIDPSYMLIILNKILPQMYSGDLSTRHGALLSVSEIVHAFANVTDSVIKLNQEIVNQILEVVPTYSKQNQFRGVGGDLNKESCCFLIMKCSLGKLIISDDIRECWQQLINDCLIYDSIKVKYAAADALSAFSGQYYIDNRGKVIDLFLLRLRDYAVQMTTTNNENIRLGYSLALGLLPTEILDCDLHFIVSHLMRCTMIDANTSHWVASRKQAVDSLVIIWKTHCSDPSKFKAISEFGLPILNKLLDCLTDYTKDKRGDIGRTVRESAMKGIEVITTSNTDKTSMGISISLMEVILSAIAKQAVEKIHSIKQTATSVFINILFSDNIPPITHHSEIKSIFEGKSSSLLWYKESDAFLLFAKLLKYPSFSRPVLSGFIKSAGGITQSLVQFSSQAIDTYIEGCSAQELTQLCKNVVEEFKSNLNNDSSIESMLLFLQKFLASPSLKSVFQDPDNTFSEEIYALTKQQISNVKDPKRLHPSVDVFCQLIQVRGKVSKKSLSTLCIFLCHRFSWLRRDVALSLSEALMMYSDMCDISAENEDEIIEILTSFDWQNSPLEEVRKTRNKLCHLLDVPVPKIISSVTKTN